MSLKTLFFFFLFLLLTGCYSDDYLSRRDQAVFSCIHFGQVYEAHFLDENDTWHSVCCTDKPLKCVVKVIP
jgi:hypothetical protein